MRTVLTLITLAFIIIGSLVFYQSLHSLPVSTKKQAATAEAVQPSAWIDTRKDDTLYHVVVGDSLAKGYGSSQGGYAGIASKLLEERLQKQVIVDNIAVNGLTTAGLLRLLEQPETQEKVRQADIITVSIGGNNILRLNRNMGILEGLKALDREKERFQTDFEQIVSIIRSHNPDALLVLSELYNPLKLEDSISSYASMFLDGWNRMIRSTADAYSPAMVLPVRKVLPNDARELLYDNVHPNDKGYQKIAELFLQNLLAYKVK